MIEQEIEHLKIKIEQMKIETVTLPSDVAIAYQTERKELFAVISRDMKKEEVVGVLDALAGQMTMNRKLKELVELQDNLIAAYRVKVVNIKRELQKELDRYED